jgi:hypothetical protein
METQIVIITDPDDLPSNMTHKARMIATNLITKNGCIMMKISDILSTDEADVESDKIKCPKDEGKIDRNWPQ